MISCLPLSLLALSCPSLKDFMSLVLSFLVSLFSPLPRLPFSYIFQSFVSYHWQPNNFVIVLDRLQLPDGVTLFIRSKFISFFLFCRYCAVSVHLGSSSGNICRTLLLCSLDCCCPPPLSLGFQSLIVGAMFHELEAC